MDFYCTTRFYGNMPNSGREQRSWQNYLSSDCKPVVFIIFFLPLNESFWLLESIVDEWELHINRADQSEITVLSVGLYQYQYFHGMIQNMINLAIVLHHSSLCFFKSAIKFKVLVRIAPSRYRRAFLLINSLVITFYYIDTGVLLEIYHS